MPGRRRDGSSRPVNQRGPRPSGPMKGVGPVTAGGGGGGGSKGGCGSIILNVASVLLAVGLFLTLTCCG